MTEAAELDGVEQPADPEAGSPAEPSRARPAVAVVSLVVGLLAAVGAAVVVHRAVQRMPALSPTDSMIVAGGRPGTPGAAAPSPVRPPLRRTPPSVRARGAPAQAPAASDPDAYPRLR